MGFGDHIAYCQPLNSSVEGQKDYTVNGHSCGRNFIYKTDGGPDLFHGL